MQQWQAEEAVPSSASFFCTDTPSPFANQTDFPHQWAVADSTCQISQKNADNANNVGQTKLTRASGAKWRPWRCLTADRQPAASGLLVNCNVWMSLGLLRCEWRQKNPFQVVWLQHVCLIVRLRAPTVVPFHELGLMLIHSFSTSLPHPKWKLQI